MLVNTSERGGSRLIEVLASEARRTITPGPHALYAISCYFDAKAVRTLVETMAEIVRERGGSLTSCDIAVDVADWFRQRVDKRELPHKICLAAKLPPGSVRFCPVTVPGRLVHAKGYALLRSPGAEAETRQGFVAVTSANLTRRGLGLAKASNIELAHVSDDSNVLDEFYQRFVWLTGAYPLRGRREREHDDFLLALRLLGAGSFFHKWEGNLSSEISFRITLTKAGKVAASAGEPIFNKYAPSGDVRSRNPINLERVFRQVPKPFPKHFWRIYSLDTALGRWVPREIVKCIREKLKDDVAPYLHAVREATSSTVLLERAVELRKDVREMKRNGWIKQDESVIEDWRARVLRFRKEKDLIQARIFNYEQVPNVLDGANRMLVLRTFRGMRAHLSLRRQQRGGLRAIMRTAIEESPDNYEKELKRLAKAARKALAREDSD